ncbi:uncharacterized protein LOC135928510 [Gordionus sp. m RMFG-2023]|uniref:uncharacterized protein LOC135928510 n=1 Tax=Gordionus sp. m RMFG-2023 TaxID=3053472 RepID=UPI0031FDE34A
MNKGNFVSELINFVEDHDDLWNQSNDNYFNRLLVDELWTLCAKKLDSSPNVCKLKWKNLRDSYLKEKRKREEVHSGDAAKASTQWKWYDSLSFLTTSTTPRKTLNNITDNIENVRPVKRARVTKDLMERYFDKMLEIDNDPDRLWCLSLVDNVMKVPNEVKDTMKINVQTLIYNYINNIIGKC